MGLDMYLMAKRSFIDRDWRSKESRKLHRRFRKLIEEDYYDSGNLGTIKISFEAAYWRKANHIHNWFVKNVQNGNDDCGNYWVAREQLEELRDLCKKILEDKDLSLAKELLPTQPGFFFGSTDYGVLYFQDLENTIKMLDKALTISKVWDFYYSSSW